MRAMSADLEYAIRDEIAHSSDARADSVHT
jgi:hypothetical protein